MVIPRCWFFFGMSGVTSYWKYPRCWTSWMNFHGGFLGHGGAPNPSLGVIPTSNVSLHVGLHENGICQENGLPSVGKMTTRMRGCWCWCWSWWGWLRRWGWWRWGRWSWKYNMYVYIYIWWFYIIVIIYIYILLLSFYYCYYHDAVCLLVSPDSHPLMPSLCQDSASQNGSKCGYHSTRS